MPRKYLYPALVILLLVQNMPHAEDFGRLFTTPKQRQQLDEIRKVRTNIIIEIKDEEITIDQDIIVEVSNTEELQVKGLVYRSDGKNTAWINETNSYEGNLVSDYFNVDSSRIKENEITVEIPLSRRSIKMKVGQSYNPALEQIRDVLPPSP